MQPLSGAEGLGESSKNPRDAENVRGRSHQPREVGDSAHSYSWVS
jgi:hypothetical protein